MSHLVADIIEVKMADTINIILEFLHRHHFSKAAAVLREEVTARQQLNGLLPLPLNDDRDLDVAIYLKSVQEKAGEHHHLVDAALEKHEPDTQNKPGREVKPSAQQLKQEQEIKEKLHGQDESQSTAELEEPESEPEPLFMEFEVGELEYSGKPVHSVRVSPLPAKDSSISKKTLPETRKSPVRDFKLWFCYLRIPVLRAEYKTPIASCYCSV